MGVNTPQVVALEPTEVNISWRDTTALGSRNANAGEREGGKTGADRRSVDGWKVTVQL